MIFFSGIVERPRSDSSYTINMKFRKSWKAKDYLYFFFNIMPLLIVISEFQKQIQKNFFIIFK